MFWVVKLHARSALALAGESLHGSGSGWPLFCTFALPAQMVDMGMGGSVASVAEMHQQLGVENALLEVRDLKQGYTQFGGAFDPWMTSEG